MANVDYRVAQAIRIIVGEEQSTSISTHSQFFAPEFRKKVKRAFRTMYGPAAKLDIQIASGDSISEEVKHAWNDAVNAACEGILGRKPSAPNVLGPGAYCIQFNFFRPTEKLYSIPRGLLHPSREIITRLDAGLLAAVKKGAWKLCDLTPRQFEEFVAELLAKYGYDIELRKETHDGGYDVFGCRVDALGVSTPLIVQCKRYRSNHKVGVSLVRELHAVQTSLNIPNAVLATTSTATRDACDFATKHVRWGFLKIADHDTLLDWVRQT